MRSRHPSQVVTALARAMAVLVILSVAIFDTAYVLGLHLHVLPDGRVVAHSHPVDRSEESGSQHQHTKQDYAVLSVFGRLLEVHAFAAGWSAICVESVGSCIVLSHENVISTFAALEVDKRAPPEVISTY